MSYWNWITNEDYTCWSSCFYHVICMIIEFADFGCMFWVGCKISFFLQLPCLSEGSWQLVICFLSVVILLMPFGYLFLSVVTLLMPFGCLFLTFGYLFLRNKYLINLYFLCWVQREEDPFGVLIRGTFCVRIPGSNLGSCHSPPQMEW